MGVCVLIPWLLLKDTLCTFKSTLTTFARCKAQKSKTMVAENNIRCFTTEIAQASL